MNKALLVYIALAALTLGVFAIWPELDLAGARYFYHGGGFFGRDSFERFGRDFFRVTPFVVLVACAALWLAKRLGATVRWAPSGRAVIFLAATMAIGPGLIVNLGFKDHWGRPRPYQTENFNGADPFKPWYDDRRRVQEELFVRLRRSGDRLLDGRAGERAAARHGAVPRSSPPSPSGSARAC